MPNRYPREVRDRAVRVTTERLGEYPSPYAACVALAPKLNVGVETLREWVVQAQVDAGDKTGPTSAELEEISSRRHVITRIAPNRTPQRSNRGSALADRSG